MKIYEGNEFAKPSEIDKIEREMEAQLPQDYKAFLQQYNGGYPEPDRFLFYSQYPDNFFGNGSDGNRAILDRFLGLHDSEHDNLTLYLRVYQGRIPSTMIPIAHDPGGNLLCMAVKGEDEGKIFYWVHDEEAEDDEVPSYRNLYFVSESFTALLTSLKA